MENLNREEADLALDALNSYWHKAIDELLKKDLGDIERKNWEAIMFKSNNLMQKILDTRHN